MFTPEQIAHSHFSISNKYANFIFLGFSTTNETSMYHLLTVNVRVRTEINIPPGNFVKEKSPDFADAQSNLRLLFCIVKHLQCILSFNKTPFL